MNETEIVVTVESDGERLCGNLGLPSGLDPGERRAGVVVMHGFGGNMEDFSRVAAPLLRSLGYVTLRFDFRGCGRSTGMRGLVLVEDEVSDALNAVSFLEQRPNRSQKNWRPGRKSGGSSCAYGSSEGQAHRSMYLVRRYRQC